LKPNEEIDLLDESYYLDTRSLENCIELKELEAEGKINISKKPGFIFLDEEEISLDLLKLR
jgi:hypothetical protein